MPGSPEEILRRAQQVYEARARRAEAAKCEEVRLRNITAAQVHLSTWDQAAGHQELVRRIAAMLKVTLDGRSLPDLDARDTEEEFAIHLYQLIVGGKEEDALRLLDAVTRGGNWFQSQVLSSLCGYLPAEVQWAVREAEYREAGTHDGTCLHKDSMSVPQVLSFAVTDLLTLFAFSIANNSEDWNSDRNIEQAERYYNTLHPRLSFLRQQANPEQWGTLRAWQLVQQFAEQARGCPGAYSWRLRWAWLNHQGCFAALREANVFDLIAEVGEMERCLQGKRPAAVELPLLLPTTSNDRSRLSGNQQAADPFVFALDGNGYLIKGFGETGHLSGYKGLNDIAILLRTPKQLVLMSELIGTDPEQTQDLHSQQPTLDKQAIQEIRGKLAEQEDDLAKAERTNSTVEADIAREEIERLRQSLTVALGKSGKPRDLNNPCNQWRPALSNRLKTAYRAMREAQPPMTKLAEHFELSISSEGGNSFIYRPAGDPPSWQLGGVKKK